MVAEMVKKEYDALDSLAFERMMKPIEICREFFHVFYSAYLSKGFPALTIEQLRSIILSERLETAEKIIREILSEKVPTPADLDPEKWKKLIALPNPISSLSEIHAHTRLVLRSKNAFSAAKYVVIRGEGVIISPRAKQEIREACTYEVNEDREREIYESLVRLGEAIKDLRSRTVLPLDGLIFKHELGRCFSMNRDTKELAVDDLQLIKVAKEQSRIVGDRIKKGIIR